MNKRLFASVSRVIDLPRAACTTLVTARNQDIRVGGIQGVRNVVNAGLVRRWYHGSSVLRSEDEIAEKSGPTEEQLEIQRKKTAARIKLIDETDRYNREKLEYEAAMKDLRRKYVAHSAAKRKKETQEKEERIDKAKALEMVRRKQQKETIDHYKKQRTDLELTPLELLASPAERRAQHRQNRVDKLRRRKLTATKLLKLREFNEAKHEQMVNILANEASQWISAEDMKDEELFNAKLQAKLLEVQPITATFESALPNHHYKESEKWASSEETYNDFVYYMNLEKEEERATSKTEEALPASDSAATDRAASSQPTSVSQ